MYLYICLYIYMNTYVNTCFKHFAGPMRIVGLVAYFQMSTGGPRVTYFSVFKVIKKQLLRSNKKHTYTYVGMVVTICKQDGGSIRDHQHFDSYLFNLLERWYTL